MFPTPRILSGAATKYYFKLGYKVNMTSCMHPTIAPLSTIAKCMSGCPSFLYPLVQDFYGNVKGAYRFSLNALILDFLGYSWEMIMLLLGSLHNSSNCVFWAALDCSHYYCSQLWGSIPSKAPIGTGTVVLKNLCWSTTEWFAFGWRTSCPIKWRTA